MDTILYFCENFNYHHDEPTDDELIVFFVNSHEFSYFYGSLFRNCELAFTTASDRLGIPALLDPEDIVMFEAPDPLSIMTYVSTVYHTFTSASSSGRRARSVSRPRAGAMDRLLEEARRARSVSSRRSGKEKEAMSVRAASPPLEMENPFKMLDTETEPEIKQTQESSVTRRSKKRSSETKLRVRSLFVDNFDRDLPSLEEDTRDTCDTRPRHVLSYSSYAMPYRSTGCLASASEASLGGEEAEPGGRSSWRRSTRRLASFLKSKVERLNSSEKRKSQNFFETNLQLVENNKPTIS